MSIPRTKPVEMLDAEWVAMHSTFELLGYSGTAFAEAFKGLMIEVLADRLYPYRAIDQLLARIKEGEFGRLEGIPTDHRGCAALKEAFKLGQSILRGAADKWRGEDPLLVQCFPAWELVPANLESWVERWQQAGGGLTIGWRHHLPGEPTSGSLDFNSPDRKIGVRLIAAKIDPVWEALADVQLFPDSYGFPHPPFVKDDDDGPSDYWAQISRVECQVIGLRFPDGQWVEDPAGVDRERFFAEEREVDLLRRRPKILNGEY